MGNAFVAGLKNEAPRGRDNRTEIPKLVKEAPSVMPKGPSLVTYIVINTLLGRVTRHPAGMHCPSWDDASVSSCFLLSLVTISCHRRQLRNVLVELVCS